MYYTAEEITKKGEFIDKWPCDVNYQGEQESNGSQEFYYEYKGHDYIVWMDWNDKPLEPNKVIEPLQIDFYY